MLLRFVLTVLAALTLSSPAAAKTWYRADTHHFVIYSDGTERQLTDFAHKIEKFDALVRVFFARKPEVAPNRLTIYLLNNASSVNRLHGRKGQNVAGFYKPLPEGSYAVANRKRGGEYQLDGQTVLFHEYAHHFMFRNMPVPTPAWFTEGFAEFMSTAEFQRDGGWSFGGVANHRAYSLLQGSKVPIRTLLTEKPSGNINAVSSFYGWAWALTHMLYQSGEQGQQIDNYLKRLNEGEDALEAAEDVFGDLDVLQKDLRKYVRGKMAFFKSDTPISYLSDIKVERLSEYRSALTELTLHRQHWYEIDRTRDKLRELSAHPEADAEVWYQLAKLAYDDAHRADAAAQYDFSVATDAIDRALAMQPDHLMANVLKGDILLEPFDHDLEFEPSAWNKARRYYMAANLKDPLNPYPLFKFGQSFLREGTDHAQRGVALEEAFFGAPESQEIRFALVRHYQLEGEYDKAIALVKVVAGNPHSGGGARRLIQALEIEKNGGSALILPFEGMEEDETEQENLP